MSRTLADLAPGESGVVAGFATVDDGARRLMEMGVIEGTPVELVRRAPAGDPVEIRVMGYALSLRRSEAANVRLDESA